MEKNCRELTKVYVYRKLSGGEAMHLNLFSGNDSYFNRKIFEKQALGKRINRLDIKHPEKQQKKIQLIAL